MIGNTYQMNSLGNVRLVTWALNDNPQMVAAPVECKRCNILIVSPTTGTTLNQCPCCRGFLTPAEARAGQ